MNIRTVQRGVQLCLGNRFRLWHNLTSQIFFSPPQFFSLRKYFELSKLQVEEKQHPELQVFEMFCFWFLHFVLIFHFCGLKNDKGHQMQTNWSLLLGKFISYYGIDLCGPRIQWVNQSEIYHPTVLCGLPMIAISFLWLRHKHQCYKMFCKWNLIGFKVLRLVSV